MCATALGLHKLISAVLLVRKLIMCSPGGVVVAYISGCATIRTMTARHYATHLKMNMMMTDLAKLLADMLLIIQHITQCLH